MSPTQAPAAQVGGQPAAGAPHTPGSSHTPENQQHQAPKETIMSTTTTDRPATRTSPAGAGAPAIEDVGGVSFARLLGTELRKLVDTRTGRWLLIAVLVITAVAMGITMWVERETGSGMYGLLIAANIPQAILIPILGIMTAANEWSQRTALITFTQEPRRLRVMAAKTVAVILLGLAVLVVTVLAAVAAHAVSMTLADGAIDAWIGWTMLGHIVVLQVQGVLMGVAFGALFLNVPLGIVAYILVPSFSPLIFMMTSWLRENAGWFDMSVSQAALLSDQSLTGEQWAQFGTSSALWILLPLVIGFWRVARREVK